MKIPDNRILKRLRFTPTTPHFEQNTTLVSFSQCSTRTNILTSVGWER